MYICMHMYVYSTYFYLVRVCNQKYLQTTTALNALIPCAASDSMSQLTKGFDIHYRLWSSR